MSEWNQVVVSVAQVAVGGGIVQAILAFTRRRSELRQLDRNSDSMAVETADRVVGMLRAELDAAKAEITAMQGDRAAERALHAADKADLQRQIASLAEQLSAVRAELALSRAEIARIQGGHT